ncbi:MAG: LysM peptidoglycan-binding domain-containing protein [Acidobacteriota bacterium]
MVQRLPSRFTVALLTVFALTWVACGSSLKTPVVTPAGPPHVQGIPSQPAPPPAEDPALALIADSDRHFKAGQAELALGHAVAAKQEFDRALNLLMESPYGGRTEPRIREHFDRLVDRISTYEVKALTEGDGFTEQRSAPATIDELLALSTTFDVPLPAQELRSAIQADLASSGHDISIPLNQRVLSYVALFQGRLHDFIETGMKRGSKYLPMIQSVFRAEGLPLDLAYVPLVESAFNPNALSRAKAKGVWQFMVGTGLENGLRSDWYIDERSDPAKATVAAAKYLKTLVTLFSGDWHLALASYNGGPGRVQKALKRVGVDDFWTLADNPTVLPRETREYVPMILAAIIIARNPAQYGFEVEPEVLPESEAVTLSHPVDLRRVAEWAGTTIDQIQALNPELRRWTTPLKDSSYELKVPAGTGELVTARLQDAPPLELVSLQWYTVKKGETLLAVARKLGVAQSDLAEANELKSNARLAAGQKLLVPREATVLMAARTERTVPVADSRPISTQAPLLAQNSTNSNRVKVSYLVREGDTLSSIAKIFRTSVASLQTWNRIQGSFIATGDRLTIYTARAVPAD